MSIIEFGLFPIKSALDESIYHYWKEIMKRSQLKIIMNKTGKDIDLYKVRKQRNLVVNLYKKRKRNF